MRIAASSKKHLKRETPLHLQIRKHTLGRGRLSALVLALSTVAVLAFASSASAAVVYDNIESASYVENPVSLGYAATGTAEFGSQIALNGAAVNPEVEVLLSVWSCESGDWTSGCTSTPGDTFAAPLTLNVYEVEEGNEVGALIESVSKTFNLEYRPTSTPAACEGDVQRFINANGVCNHGKPEAVSFSLGTNLPHRVIVSVAYNTLAAGYSPTGVSGPLDSLNVALEGPSTVGSNPVEGQEVVYWATQWYPSIPGTNVFEAHRGEDWSVGESQIAAKVTASGGPQPEPGPAGPQGEKGATGATGPAGPAGSSETIALKRKMSVNVVKSSVQLNGGVAPVLVRCTGSVLQRCVGTLTLKAKGTVQKAAYSVPRGKTATVSVPLSNALLVKTESSAGGSTVARAVTRTEQSSGRPFRTSRKLHLH